MASAANAKASREVSPSRAPQVVGDQLSLELEAGKKQRTDSEQAVASQRMRRQLRCARAGKSLFVRMRRVGGYLPMTTMATTNAN